MAEEVTIRDADVQRFADKLDQWGDSLPDAEKAMLQLLLSRSDAGAAPAASAAQAHDVSVGSSPGDTAKHVLGPLLRNGATASLGTAPNIRCSWSTWSRGIPPT